MVKNAGYKRLVNSLFLLHHHRTTLGVKMREWERCCERSGDDEDNDNFVWLELVALQLFLLYSFSSRLSQVSREIFYIASMLCLCWFYLTLMAILLFSTGEITKTIQKYNQQSNNNLFSLHGYLSRKEESWSWRKWFNVFVRVLLFLSERRSWGEVNFCLPSGIAGSLSFYIEKNIHSVSFSLKIKSSKTLIHLYTHWHFI